MRRLPLLFTVARSSLRRLAAQPRGLLAALLVVALIAALLLSAGQWGLVTDAIESTREWLTTQGALGIVVYGAIFTICSFLALPVAPWTVVGALVYGPVLGFFVIHGSATLAAVCTFLFARRWLRPNLPRAFGDWNRVLASAGRSEAMRLVLLLRMSPVVPFAVLNYAAGLSRMRLADFFLASAVGKLPNAALYAYSVAAAERLWNSPPSDGASSLLFWLGLGATGLAVWQLGRVAARSLGAPALSAAEGPLLDGVGTATATDSPLPHTEPNGEA